MSIGGLSGSSGGMQRLQPPLREELLRRTEARQRDGTAAGELRTQRPDTPTALVDTGTNLPGFRLTDADGNDDYDSTELSTATQATLRHVESTVAFARQRAGAAVDAAEDRDAVAAARTTAAAGSSGGTGIAVASVATDEAALERRGAGAATAVQGDAAGVAAGRIERNFPWLPNAASKAVLTDAPPAVEADTGAAPASASTAPAQAEAGAGTAEAPAPVRQPEAPAREDALQAVATADADGDQRLDAGEAATPAGALGRTLNPALTAAAPAAQEAADADAASASPSSALPLHEGGLDMQAERLAAWMVQRYAAAGGQAVPGVGQQVDTSA